MQNAYPEPSDDGACRSLVEALHHYSGASAFDDVLMPWIDAHPGEVAWLASFADRTGEPIPRATLEERWRLYALGRLCELLRQAAYTQLPFRLSDKQFHAFTERLGLDTSGPATYSPFYHEVVQVLPARDPRQAPCFLAEEWPCLMLGDLLLMRAGVLVEAGEDTLRTGIADAATLYWTYEREGRPTHDLAHGWGRNSAWRSAFRRDYHIGDTFYFNVDGTVDLAALDPHTCDEYGLTRAERIELLVNRSFVITAKPHADLFPYNERLTLPIRPSETARPRWWKTLLG